MGEHAKVTPANVLSILARLSRDPMSGANLNPPATETAISEMQAAASCDLGEPVPDGYVSFLRVTNGAQINGAYFKAAEHLVLENLDVPRSEIIVLGNEGNVAEFVFDRRDRRFHTINMGHSDEPFDSFDSFEALLITVLREQQVYPRGEGT